MEARNEQQIKRIVIAGPTASGKSEIAAELAAEIGSVVISADARQCYKELDIGTAKPGPELLEKVPHHYISELEPDEKETAAVFRKRCDRWEEEHFSRSEVPVVYAGGSTLYLQSVLFNLDPVPPSNQENLEQLKQESERSGMEPLAERLNQVDPEYMKRIDGLNRHRIFRALDVWMQTGKPFSSFHSASSFKKPRPGTRVFMPDWPREELHRRINARVDQMIDSGLEQEVKQLLEKWPETLQSLQTVGYREVIACLKGELSREQMVADIKTNTRRYAKRQLTWFRRWDFVEKLPADGRRPADLAAEIRSRISGSFPRKNGGS